MIVRFFRAFRGNSAKWKMDRYRKKIKVLERHRYTLSKQIKQLMRENAKIRRDVADLVYEVCNSCGTEIAIRWDAKADGFTAHCPVCGEKVLLCSICDKGIESCGVCGFGYADDSCLQEVEEL